MRRLLERIRFTYVALSGGEPLVYPHLDRLLRFLTRAGQTTILTTNGRLATRARVERLRAAGLGALQVPLLAAEPRLHDELSGRPSWTQAIAAVARGLEAGISTSVTFVATSRNLGELSPVTELAAGLGVRGLVVNELHPTGSAAASGAALATDPAALRAELARAREIAARERLAISFVPADGYAASGGGWHRVAVTPACEVKLCNQSAATLGRLSDLDDTALDALSADLALGALAAYRERVDNCACFDARLRRRTGRRAAAPRRRR